jgi:hypothetical protein
VLSCGEPVGSGFAASWARPGGNITGASMTDVLVGKRVELLKDATRSPSSFSELVRAVPIGHPLSTAYGFLRSSAANRE